MRQVGTTDLGTVDARAWPALAAGLAAAKEPRLVCARLEGGEIALGRWQDGEVVLTPEALEKKPIRRATGGRAIAMGTGTLAVALALPHRSFLESEHANTLPAQRFLNRAVRLLLSALARRGLPSTYGGRDFVTVGGSQGPYVSFDIAPGGGALFEAIVPAEAHWWLPAELSRLPEQPEKRGVPGPGMIRALEGCSSATLLDAMATGIRERFALETQASDAPIVPVQIPELPRLPKRSAPVEIPIGWASASVAMADGRVSEARLSGDFLADSAGMAALSDKLRGCAPTFEAFAAALDAVYGNPAHAMLGTDDLATLARALVSAAESA